jgi:ABC-type transporter Mla maintaining outer membrane lipid asymmetry ATPase subunit MlaF
MTNYHSPAAIRVTGLRKSYGQQVVLDGIDFDVAEGGGTIWKGRSAAFPGASRFSRH